MRKGEILGLRWKDCDLEEGKISNQQTLAKARGKLTFQEPKTSGSERTITLPHYATSCLEKHKIAQAQLKLKLGSAYQDNDLVVCSAIGNPIDTSDINKDMAYVIKKHNLPKISFHGLRHTHATMLLSIGENAKVVSERLGHANIGITLNTYSHVLPNMQKSLAENFDTAMKKNSPKTI
nr:site-specific integrase [Shimazuella alba]